MDFVTDGGIHVSQTHIVVQYDLVGELLIKKIISLKFTM